MKNHSSLCKLLMKSTRVRLGFYHGQHNHKPSGKEYPKMGTCNNLDASALYETSSSPPGLTSPLHCSLSAVIKRLLSARSTQTLVPHLMAKPRCSPSQSISRVQLQKRCGGFWKQSPWGRLLSEHSLSWDDGLGERFPSLVLARV